MNALIAVDIQHDFMPGGALAVAEGDQIVPVINDLTIDTDFDRVVFTRDFHPDNHCSFKENGGPWPVHCVKGTNGAAIHKDLKQLINRYAAMDRLKIVLKGQRVDCDSYSGFWDNEKKFETELASYLRNEGVTDIYVCGLATDYCVKFTALDGIAEGFNVTIIEDACRGVNLNPGDVDKAMKEMKVAGVRIIKSTELGTKL